MTFEDALKLAWGGQQVRRACWARIPEYTRATPPMQIYRTWRIFSSDSTPSLINGWGGQIGAMLEPGEPVRDGQCYSPTDADRTATDWELVKSE